MAHLGLIDRLEWVKFDIDLLVTDFTLPSDNEIANAGPNGPRFSFRPIDTVHQLHLTDREGHMNEDEEDDRFQHWQTLAHAFQNLNRLTISSQFAHQPQFQANVRDPAMRHLGDRVQLEFISLSTLEQKNFHWQNVNI